MVYTRKDMFEEDKWNIHSSTYRQEKYASSKSETDEKYKHEHYGSKAKDEVYKANEDYKKREDEEKKEEEGKEPSIEDAVKEEQKQKTDEEQEIFKIAAQEISQGIQKDKGKSIKTKKKETKSIEDAVNEAIKEEKETIIIE